VSVANKAPVVFGSRALMNASALVFSSGLVLSVSGFVFHAIASRRLGVEEYGAFYALLSLYSLAGLPVGIFSPVVTKFSAEFSALHDDAHVRGLIGLIVRAFAFCGVAYVVAGFALAAPLAHFLHLAVWEIPVVGLMTAIAVLSTTMRAIGQGIHAFAAYGVSTAGEGIVKVVMLLAATLAGLTIFGTVAAFLIGTAIGALLIALPLIRRYRRVPAAAVVLDWRRIFATVGGAASLTLTVTAMGFADVLLVKHYFPAQQAGLYSVASLCGKILLYFVGFVPAILIPQATFRHARGEQTRKLLWAAIGFIAIVSVLGVIAFKIAGGLLLHVLTGNAFDAALPLLPAYAGAMAALALTSSLGSYGISTHRLGFAVPLLLAMLATLAAIALVHPSLQFVVNELLAGNLLMLLLVGAALALQSRRSAVA
jgi:O-antigen/teichoic acid export membrane protein